MSREIKLGLLGSGTVGSGVVQVLRENIQEITAKVGAKLSIKTVLVRDAGKNAPNWKTFR